MTGLTGTRYCPKPPDLFASLRIVGVDQPAHSKLAAGDADNDLVFHRQRGDGDAVSRLVIGDGDVPAQLAGSHVECDQMRIECPDKKRIVEDSQTAIHLAAAGPDVPRQFLR